MNYSLEEIYKLIGKEDKVAVIDFVINSEAYNSFGDSLTIVVEYTQHEREELDKSIKRGEEKRSEGFVKVKNLLKDISDELNTRLLKSGVLNTDIDSIFPSPWASENLFHNKNNREIRKINVPFEALPNGGDYNWMYGFKKQLLKEGNGFSPDDMDSFLAMKLFFEPDEITDEESKVIRVDGILNENIHRKYLDIKLEINHITAEEQVILESLWELDLDKNMQILKDELGSAGTSMRKLAKENPQLLFLLLKGTYKYETRQFNVNGPIPIYLDYKGFLHIFLRHVKEFKVSEHYNIKDNYQWGLNDVLVVVGKIVESINTEAQGYWLENSGQDFSKYGPQSYYFEGDYYTIQIAGNGRIRTLYKNKKK